jgi:glycosyltransferase involved in cell wall biosynthesis
MEKKKILLSAYACSPIKGSEPGNGWSWATNLARLGYEVWCFSNVQEMDIVQKAKEDQKIDNLYFVFVSLPFGLDENFMNYDSKKVYLHYFLWQRKAAKLAIELHKKVKFDLGQHVSFGSLQQGTFLWKVNGIKRIFGPVGGGQEALPVLKEYFGKAWRIERIRSAISKWSVKRSSHLRNTVISSDYVLVTNKDTENLVKTIPGHDPAKIYFVPDTAVPPAMEGLDYIPKQPKKITELLWVGRFLPRKGLNLVLNALAYIAPGTEYRLTIVGGGEQFHLLDEWISAYKIDRSKLNIVGQIPFSEVKEYYRQSDVFVFCSLRDSFPAQLIEAMAFSLPLIVLDIHGSAIGVPDDCGIRVPVVTKEDTLNGIAAAIEKMCNDSAYRQACGLNAYEHSRRSTWKNKVDYVTSKFYS